MGCWRLSICSGAAARADARLLGIVDTASTASSVSRTAVSADTAPTAGACRSAEGPVDECRSTTTRDHRCVCSDQYAAAAVLPAADRGRREGFSRCAGDLATDLVFVVREPRLHRALCLDDQRGPADGRNHMGQCGRLPCCRNTDAAAPAQDRACRRDRRQSSGTQWKRVAGRAVGRGRPMSASW